MPSTDLMGLVSVLDLCGVAGPTWLCMRCCRMKSLEADAVRAQAVIARAQEMSKDTTTATSGSTLSTVDIAFAGESVHYVWISLYFGMKLSIHELRYPLFLLTFKISY